MGRYRQAKSKALEIKFMSQSISDATAVASTASNANFASFDLPETMLVTLAREGLVEPTPIQALAIPLLLDGKDLIGLAQTGTGKTAAFLLPLMTHLGYSPAVRAGHPPKALILAPTRELANQISQNVQKLAADLNLRHIAVFGGARYDTQIRGLRRGVDIVVATPGRLQDLMERGAFDPSGITHFVLDEADHMLDLGFYPAIKRIAASLPARRQTMLFSATMPPEIEALGQQFLQDPERVKAPQTGITADKVTQRVTLLAEADKRDRLSSILGDHTTGQALIFVRTKRRADALAKFLSVRGFAVDALHGDMRQSLRQKVLRNFRDGQLQALIATDVAARGIDVAGLNLVINFDLTDTPEAYVHRIGRTGRAGLGGIALSFCAPDERHKLSAIISVVGARIELFELDGTAVTEFQSAPAPTRRRRRSAKPAGRMAPRKAASPRSDASPRKDASSRSDAPSRKDAASRPEKRHAKPFDAPKRDRGPGATEAKDTKWRKTKRPQKPKANPRPPRRGGDDTPSAQQLFSKRPKFNSRPRFEDAAPNGGGRSPAKDTSQSPKRPGKAVSRGASTGAPSGRKPQRGQASKNTMRQAATPKPGGKRPQNAGQRPNSRTQKNRGQGGQGRLKRRS